MNAKNEFLYLIKDRKLECATILYHVEDNEFTGAKATNSQHILKQNHSQKEYDDFIDSLDFEYDSGHGLQELFGMVWFKDGTWAERSEYDGSEWWSLRSRPVIPESLKDNV